jgi:hypothetical protein
MGIQEWLLSSRDFETGRQLYEQFGSSAVLKKMFTQGATVFNREKLAKELAAMVVTAPVATVIALPKPVTAPVPAPAKTVSDPTKKVLEQIQPLLEERRHHHTRLEMVYTSAERRELAFRILELSEQLTPLWELYNFAKAHGQLPEQPKPAGLPVNQAELVQHRNNLRSLITKLRKKPHRLNDLLAKEKELEEVERIIHGKE